MSKGFPLRKAVILLSILSLYVSLCSGSASYEVEETYTIKVSKPELVERDGKYSPLIEDYEYLAETNLPMLPYKTVYLDIPENAGKVKIKLKDSKTVSLGKVDDIAVVPALKPISGNKSKAEENSKTKISGIYPHEVYGFKGVKHLRKNNLAAVDIYPIQYDTCSNELFFSKEIVLEISYELPEVKRSGGSVGSIALEHKTLGGGNASNISYIIVTNSSLVSEFQPLADWKTKKGVPARIYNTSWIYATYPQTDNILFYSGHANLVSRYMETSAEINLTNASNAFLNYSIVYNIEEDYDFAYVDVSTNGGLDWDQLKTYTGYSGGWVHATVNLTGYAGNEVLLRFRYETDLFVGYDGFSVDNISVETDEGVVFSDDGESGSGKWVLSGFSLLGDRPQAKALREFIKDMYTTYGIQWVLLGGDVDIIPLMGAFTSFNDADTVDTSITADLYYSDLDGDWNNDGDNIYGETVDGIDMMPDVYVGRAPVNTITEVQAFVNKTLAYEKNPPTDYQKDVLFLGANLDASTWGGDCKDAVEPYIPASHSITKKYEKYGSISVAITTSEMNSGPHIVNHAGHGDTNYFDVNGAFFNANADGLTNNPKNFILYTVSCYSNQFESNSLSEHFMNNPDGGTVAYIGNTRYGLYYGGSPGIGPSDRYDQQFFNSLFNKNLYHLGQVHADAKAYYVSSSSSDGAYRWLQYAINLLGDPELPVWTDTPKNLTVEHPTNISLEESILTINVTDGGGSPVVNATVCLQKENEVYVYDKTDSDGNATFNINPLTQGSMNVTVTAYNFLPYENTMIVKDLNAPTVTLEAPYDGTFQNNVTVDFFYTPNETISSLKNCSLYGNFTGSWKLNQTDTAPDNGVLNNFTINLVEGRYLWNVECTDNNGNSGFAGVNWAVTVDVTPPTIDFVKPTQENGAEIDFETFTVNVSHMEANPEKLIFYLNGTLEYRNYSGGYTVINRKLSNGFYNYSIRVNDSAGNWNQTETRNLTVNATPPTVSLISPDNKSFSKGNVTLTCNATDNIKLKNITLYWSYMVWGANETKYVGGTSNQTSFVRNSLQEGDVVWNCRACDNSSNCAFSAENFSFTVDSTKPDINGYSINPKIVINGSNVSLSVNATDLNLYSMWASILLPDLTQRIIDLPVNYIANITGDYNVTFYANDSAGNEVNTSDYFISAEGIQFNSSSVDYNNSCLNVTLRAYFEGDLIEWNQSIGDVVLNIASYTYDLEFSIYSNTLVVLLRGVNLSVNNGRSMGFDRLNLSGYLAVYAINNSYETGNASLNLSYSDTGYGNGDYLSIYRCNSWDLSERNCSGGWEEIVDAVNDKVDERFLLNVTSFSGFGIKQEPYCGDGVVNGGEACDGSDFGGKTCVSLGFDYGSLSCIDCAISTSGCGYRSDGSGGGSGGGSYGAKPKPSCFDGIHNCHHGLCEMGVDCGGPCDPCMSCSDGIQNQGEEGVDCGGPCDPCRVAVMSTSTSTTFIGRTTTTTKVAVATTFAVTDTIQTTTSTISQKSGTVDPIPFIIVFAEILLIIALYTRYKGHVRVEKRREVKALEDEITGEKEVEG